MENREKEKGRTMEELNLFDFGLNEKGEYVDLVEEAKVDEKVALLEVNDFVDNHDNPLVRVIFRAFYPFYMGGRKVDPKAWIKEIEDILATKCYHYGNMNKNLYIYSLQGRGKFVFVFENENHYIVECSSHFTLEPDAKGVMDVHDFTIDEYLSASHKDAYLCFPACNTPCFDSKGNSILEYYDGKLWQKDIRHIVCIKEWQMDKYSFENRVREGNAIKDFYEVKFYLKDLINYWGEEQ